jgi:putative tricarboxylic transport membrane protein
MFVAAVTLYETASLDTGNIVRMGPGFVPRMLGWLLLALSIPLLAHIFIPDQDGSPNFAARPFFVILASLAFFGIALETLGLVVTVIGTSVISSFAYRGSRMTQVVPLSIVLALFTLLLFIWALGLPIPAWPNLGDA